LVNISVYDNLKKYGITHPAVTAPVAAFVPHVQTGNLIFVTGHIAKKDGKPWVGQLGAQLNTEHVKRQLAESPLISSQHGTRWQEISTRSAESSS
jgi:hypothetical protein